MLGRADDQDERAAGTPRTPDRIRLRPTVGFALLSVVASLSLLIAVAGERTFALGFAAGAVLALAAPLVARAQVAGLGLAGPERARVVAGRTLRLPVEIHGAARGRRDLLLQASDGRRSGPACYLASLARGETRTCRLETRFADRGRSTGVGLLARSTFAFGLVSAEAHYRLGIDLCVLPRPYPCPALRRALRARAAARELAARAAGAGDEFRALHEWRAGQSQRLVAWRPSARRGRLLVREHESALDPGVRVVLGLAVAGVVRTGSRHPSFERAVSVAAALLGEAGRAGRRARLELVGAAVETADTSDGGGELLRGLELLAGAQPEVGPPGRALEHARARAAGWTSVCVVAAGGLLPRSRDVLLVDVDDEGSLTQPGGAR